MKIKFLGAAGTVTGSSYLLTANSGEKILIDLGMFQGPPELEKLNFVPLQLEARSLSGVVLTHAHLDHCGRMPILEKMGYKGDIFLTAPTYELTKLSLLDSAKIGHEDHPEKIMYDKNDVLKQVKRFRTVQYDEPFFIGELKIIFRDAGHILGSASVEIEANGQKIVFSGDLGNTPEDLMKPTEMIKSADFVVMESTYGDRLHPEGEAREIIQAEINAIETTHGTLLIPAFSLERTQEILHLISHLKNRNLINSDTAVFMDSPMAEKATSVYEKYRNFLNDEIRKDFQVSDPFRFPGLKIVENREESIKLQETNGPKVIIAGGGMMTGGRIVGHAKHYLPFPNTRLLIVGYQGEGTLGRLLLSGEKNLTIDRQPIQVKATVSDTQVMSSHADQGQLINWLSGIQGISSVILTHGEDEPRLALAEKITKDLGVKNIYRPDLYQEIVL